MPRYYFDVKNGHRLVDPAGVDCKGDDAARRQGKAIAEQIAVDVPKCKRGGSPYSMSKGARLR